MVYICTLKDRMANALCAKIAIYLRLYCYLLIQVARAFDKPALACHTSALNVTFIAMPSVRKIDQLQCPKVICFLL